jgi:tetratricopeptide (TPR) repeat protein
MASHVYERTGHYDEGVLVNDLAFAADDLYESIISGSSSQYRNAHFLAVQAFCALNGGMLQKGMPIILSCGASINPSRNSLYSQYLYMFPALAWVRMGQWESIKKSPAPSYNFSYATILDDFAKGIGCLRRHLPDSASLFLLAIDRMMHDDDLLVPDSPFSPFILPASVARNILAAEIHSGQKRTNEAEHDFKIAIEAEDHIIYAEPKRWMLPARQYYGNRLLQWKRPDEAEKILREDLVWNPGNGWSLTGIYLSLMAQQKFSEAARYKEMANKSFSGSDLDIKAPVF